MKLTIGEKIGILRKEKQITQTELAEYLFLAPQTVSRWEVGNGTPEITLLPKIATFFGISIDELFGITDIERAEELAMKYSVLRDDHSFEEAMECINSQIQTVDASLKIGMGDIAELEKSRESLETLKLHMWIQQGREAFERALKITDSFVEKTEGNPEHPWYLPMRLQKNQLLTYMGKSREVLAECIKNFKKNPTRLTLRIYLDMLSNMQNYEEILSIQEKESSAKEIIFPPSNKNLNIWWLLIHAASEIGEINFVEKNMPSVLEVCSEEDEFDFLMILLNLYKEKPDEKIDQSMNEQPDKILDKSKKEKLDTIRNRLCALLPKLSIDKYRLENIKRRIEQS